MSDVWYLFDPKHPRRTFAKWETVERQTLTSPRAAQSALAARLSARARACALERD